MHRIKGITLVEALIGFAGLGILLLMIYTIFLGGMENWTTLRPQIDARSVAQEILYGKEGKKGKERGGLVNEIKESVMIRRESPEVGVPKKITTGSTTLNLVTSYRRGREVESFAICYEWCGTPTKYHLDNSVSTIGTLTKIIWPLKIRGTVSSWGTPTKIVLANNIRMGSITYPTGSAYPLFRYYNALGIERHGNQLENAITAREIRQIGISMIFDIDNDRDGRRGEDPPGGGNQDRDRKLDEDRPNDFSIKTKVTGINLGRGSNLLLPRD